MEKTTNRQFTKTYTRGIHKGKIYHLSNRQRNAHLNISIPFCALK